MTPESGWKSPTIIVSVLGLAISLSTNLIQCNQNNITNKKADLETIRADKELQKSQALQQKKEEWINSLQSQLDNIDAQIKTVRENLRLDEIETTLENYDDRKAAIDKVQADTKKLNELTQKRAIVAEQLSSFQDT